jgi:predicted CXXCH cytochrome family protein
VGSGTGEAIAVSHFEQLAQSQCARASAGKLWCGTCHQPHGEAADRAAQIRAVCVSCHKTPSAEQHRTGLAECTSCHMPRRPTTDVQHAAITDHRIQRRPAAATSSSESEVRAVTVWRTPPAEFAGRDLALAEVFAGASKNNVTLRDDGFHMLEALPAAQRDSDADVLSALEGWDLQRQNTGEAMRLGRRVVELRPQSATAAMNLGIVLKRSGDTAEAERQLDRAIALDPSLKQAYGELATLYATERRSSDAIAVMDRYLKWNPQDILFRLQRARLAGAQ